MQQIITNHYEIYYDRRSVIVYSSDRLTFEPKGWQIDLKRDLRNAVKQLRASKCEGIVAVYGVDNGKGFIDTENALFYNMGTAVFHEVAQNHIAFDTLSSNETTCLFADVGKPQYHHYYSYHVSVFCPLQIKPLLSWERLPLFSLRGEHKPFDFWKLLREKIDEVTVSENQDYTGQFSIELNFYETDVKPINLANPMKPLLDGIICAFHKMPNDIDTKILSDVSKRLSLPVERLLCREKTLLGEEVYVKPYRNYVFWNPQDNRCSAVNMSIEYGADRRCFSGRIYKV